MRVEGGMEEEEEEGGGREREGGQNLGRRLSHVLLVV